MSQSATKIIERQMLEQGIPVSRKEFRFDAVRKWRFDYAWPNQKLALEIEGGAFINGRHTRPKGFSADIEKYNIAGIQHGWLVLRATTQQVKSGKAIEWLIQFFENGE